MRFTSRLERELLEAARREERRPALLRLLRAGGVPVRRMLAPAAGLAVFLLVAVVLATVALRAGDRDVEQPVAPASVFGTYRVSTPDGEVRLVLVRGGYLLEGAGIHINGALRVLGNRLRLIRPSGNELPEAVGGEHVSSIGLPPGVPPPQRRDCTLARSAAYRWELAERRLRLEALRDPCPVRERVLTMAPLERTR